MSQAYQNLDKVQDLKLVKSTPHFYKKGESEYYSGLVIHQEWQYIENRKVENMHVALKSKDLYMLGLGKVNYRLGKKGK